MSDVVCPAPGIYHNIDFDSYRQWKAINSGAVSRMRLSPLHGRYCLDGLLDDGDSPDMRFGRQIHLMLLEPERSKEELVVAQWCSAVMKTGDRKGEECGGTARYTNGAEWRCGKHETPGFTECSDFLTPSEYKRACQMIDSLRGSEANRLLKGHGWTEASIVFDWLDCKFKGRIDRLKGDYTRIIDLKKIRGGMGSPKDVRDCIARRGYHRQAALYWKGIKELTGVEAEFLWVFLEDQPPYDVQVVHATTADIECGLWEVEQAVNDFKRCEQAGEYHGYIAGTSVTEGALPGWYLAQHERERNETADTVGDVGGTAGRPGRPDSGTGNHGDYHGVEAAAGGDDEWSRYVAEHS